MSTIRRSITALVLAASVAGTAGSTLPANAHAGHAPPMIKITRPAAGTSYVNDVAQSGSVEQVGDLLKPAASLGKSLTITVSWECPPRSTGAVVTTKVRNSDGAVVHAVTAFGGPAGSSSTTWTTGTSGTYTIETSVSCHHWEQGPNGTTKVDDGGDADSRQVIVVAN